MRQTGKTVKRWVVVSDGQHVLDEDIVSRFHCECDAIEFARRHEHYGRPAIPERHTVPKRIADRWAYSDIADPDFIQEIDASDLTVSKIKELEIGCREKQGQGKLQSRVF